MNFPNPTSLIPKLKFQNFKFFHKICKINYVSSQHCNIEFVCQYLYEWHVIIILFHFCMFVNIWLNSHLLFWQGSLIEFISTIGKVRGH